MSKHINDNKIILNHNGFTLVELIVVMAIFITVIMITSSSFNVILGQVIQQSKNVESNIEGVIGLEMMRADIDSAGYGLPWSINTAMADYEEAVNTPYSDYNDAPSGAPRGILSHNNVTGRSVNVQLPGSDYLVLRATTLGSNMASQRWSYMSYSTAARSWQRENLVGTDRVIVLKTGFTKTGVTKELVINSTGDFSTTFSALGNYSPQEKTDLHLIYGVSGTNDLRMPFNRSDYYVRIPATSEWGNKLPKRCANGTGILFKANISHSNGNETELPLLDCVADMQVVYALDANSNGSLTSTDDISALSAADIRTQVKKVQVFILTHEGGKDRTYTYPSQTITVGPGTGTGRTFDFAAAAITGWQNYRWKVYQMSLYPKNLSAVQQ